MTHTISDAVKTDRAGYQTETPARPLSFGFYVAINSVNPVQLELTLFQNLHFHVINCCYYLFIPPKKCDVYDPNITTGILFK